MTSITHDRTSKNGRRPALRRFASTLIAIVVIGIVAAGCGGNGEDKTYETPTYPFTFKYPDGWKVTRDASLQFGGGNGVRFLAVQLAPPNNQLTISQYKLKKTLPEGVIAGQKEIDGIVKQLSKQSNGVASDAVRVAVGGLQGYQYVVDYKAGSTDLRNTVTFLFKGQDEYQINCQSDSSKRDEVDKGCKTVYDSLKFE